MPHFNRIRTRAGCLHLLRLGLLLLACVAGGIHAADTRNLGVEAVAHEKRYALVIGNNGYNSVTQLEKAVNDARAMGAALERAGFATTVLTDANRRSMNRSINQFVENIAGGGEGVFYFAGHGVQIDNQNFLLPVDLEPPRNGEDIADQAVSLQRIQDKIADVHAQYALMIIDACRDNPLPTKAGRSIGGTRGLSQPSSAQGQMVVFSAGANQKALDKLSDSDRNPNGVFTRQLLPWITQPGVSIRDVVLKVRREVYAEARSVRHEQLPAVYDQVLGDFFFVHAPAAAASVAAQPVVAALSPQTVMPIPTAQPLVMDSATPELDGVWRIGSNGKHLTIEDGRMTAMEGYSVVVAKVKAGDLLSRDIRRTGPGTYREYDLVFKSEATFKLQPDGSISGMSTSFWLIPIPWSLYPLKLKNEALYQETLQTVRQLRAKEAANK